MRLSQAPDEVQEVEHFGVGRGSQYHEVEVSEVWGGGGDQYAVYETACGKELSTVYLVPEGLARREYHNCLDCFGD